MAPFQASCSNLTCQLTYSIQNLFLCFEGRSETCVFCKSSLKPAHENLADIEDGHTLHLVERPANLPPHNAIPDPQPRQRHPRINIGMVDTNGGLAALGVFFTLLLTLLWIRSQGKALLVHQNLLALALTKQLVMQGVPAFLQTLMGANGDQQTQMITHPPPNNQEGAPEVSRHLMTACSSQQSD